MSDPSGSYEADPHPVSGHRTPNEISLDEAGPIGWLDVDVSREELTATELSEAIRDEPQQSKHRRRRAR